MRSLFTALAGAGMFVSVLVPTTPVIVPLALAAALITAGAMFAAWPWIEGRSGIDAMTAAALHPNRQADRDERTIAVANRAQVML